VATKLDAHPSGQGVHGSLVMVDAADGRVVWAATATRPGAHELADDLVARWP
jgi:hypothetical protein